MDGDQECEMSGLPQGQCAHCQSHVLIEKDRPKAIGDFRIAEYHGTCHACGDPILPGDHIAVVEVIPGDRKEDDRRLWAHYGCTSE